jgi:subtilisin family serine protease
MTRNGGDPAVGRRQFLTTSGAVLGGIAVGTQVTAATRTDRFVVDTGGRSAGRLEREGLTVVHDLSAVDLAVVRGAEDDVDAVASDYEADVEVHLNAPDEPEELADREDIFDLPASLNEADLTPRQWDKQAQSVPEAHETARGEGARVAVIDDGVLGSHPDLEHAYDAARSRNFTGDGNGIGPLFDDHGTHVAGTIAAADDGTGVVGSAPGADIVDLRVFSGPSAAFGDIVAAIVYAAEIDCDVANLSLGSYPVPRSANGEFIGSVLNRTMTHANSEGTLLVAAAGNDEADLQHDGNLVALPAEGAQGLAVAATGPEGFLFDDGGPDDPPESPAVYTNYGTNAVGLGAPGGDTDVDAIGSVPVPLLLGDRVLSTTFETPPGEAPADEDGDGLVDAGPSATQPRYGYKQGTSMAAPQVAGAAALVVSAAPDANANRVESVLRRTAAVPDGYDRTYYGSGFVDPAAAVTAVTGRGNGNGNGGNGNGN